MGKQTPKSFAKHFLAIYKGDRKAAATALKSSRNINEAYWSQVLQELNNG